MRDDSMLWGETATFRETDMKTVHFLCACSALSFAIAGSAPQAFAQSAAAAEEEPTEIVVTGSRIARPELDVANPIQAVTAEDIEQTGQTNIADVLLRAPALSASVGSSLSGGRDANFGETGVNLLDLRNLGVDRTLVLVNGKRHVSGLPNTAAVDISSMPQELIEKVDVFTGGASAVYGADGVSGVVNFVLKRNYEGVALRAQAGVSEKGDAGSRLLTLTAGKNFSDGRGNIALAYEYGKNDRVTSFARSFTGNSAKTFSLLRNIDDFPDNPNVPDRILYNNVTWADSAPDGAIDVDLDGVPDFTGSGLPYDRGIVLRSAGGRAIGGTNTPTAGYFGDIQPGVKRHVGNALASYEFSPAFKLYAEGKYSRVSAFSVGQPSFDFFTFLAPDNAFLQQRFGVAAPDGALLSRDNFDFGQRGESNLRQTYRGVIGVEGEISENARYDLSFVYGRTSARNVQTSNLIGDRYFAALDAVVNPANGQIVCRSTLFPNDPIDPNNFGNAATTFTPGANSACRPLNVLGNGVASQAALDFVLADNINRSRQTQKVVSGYISGDFDSLFKLPGGSLGFAVGAEYREESSLSTPDVLIQNGEFRDFAATPISGGKFNVKEAFAELNAPILSDRPFFHLLSASAALRVSDYSTSGNTTTWKFDGIWSPVKDIRFRGSYARAVRAPNIGELFLPASGTFLFVTDPCDVTRLGDGTSFRAANCATILGGLGLTPAQIAAFSPSTDAQATTSRRGVTGGNTGLTPEKARTWTAGVVLQPSFVPGLSVTFDWYDIRISKAVRTPTATELAELCVDQPTVANVFCQNVFRATGSGFVLGDGNDPARRIGFSVRPQNVAALKTSGADMSLRYSFTPNANLGKFGLGVSAGYLRKNNFTPSVGAAVEDAYLEQYNPRWRGSFDFDWKKGGFNLSYLLSFQSRTKRFETEQLTANPDISDPRFFHYKRLWDHNIRLAYDVNEQFQFYGGVNNLGGQKPDFADFQYPISAIGRSFFMGVKAKLR
jgi:iron complex outermembrane recepter protein